MAGVPVYGDKQVSTAPLGAALVNPGIASADAMGASVAQGAQTGLGAAFRGQERRDEIAKQEREKVADTRAMDAYLKLSEADGQLSSKSKLKTGSNAVGLPESYNGEYAKLVSERSKELADDPDAQRVFSQMAERRRVASVDDIQRHADREITNFQKASWEAGQIQARIDGQNGIISIDDSLSQQDANRQRLSEIQGLPKAEHDLLWQSDKDKTIGGFIAQQQERGDVEGAQRTLDTYAAAMSPDLRAKVTADLAKSKQAVKAQTYAAAIMQDPDQTKAKAFQQLKMIDDPELRQRATVNVEREFAQREAVKAEAQGSTYEDMADAIEGGESYDTLIARNPSAVGILDANQTAALRRVEQNNIQRRQPEEWGAEYTKARNTWSQFPDDFLKMDLRTLKGQVTKAEYDDLNERKQALQMVTTKAGAKTPEVARGFMSVDAVVKSTLRDLGINPNLEDGKIDPRAMRFTQLMDQAVEAAGGTAVVTNQQVREIADKLALEKEVIDPAGTFGKGLRFTTFGLAGLAGVGVDGTKKVRTFDLPNANQMAFSRAQMNPAALESSRKALAEVGVVEPPPGSAKALLNQYEADLLEHYNGTLLKNSQAP